EIEEYLGKEITVMEISKEDYTTTIDFSEDYSKSLKELMEEADNFEIENKKAKAKKIKKKQNKKKK
ncbi:hypothetical protein, partial [Ancylomarina sp.]|uniref:hypothetical protein n=1 Tax=Ancylomarina sp. TaxID=1970196 RepID=UPI0035653FBE